MFHEQYGNKTTEFILRLQIYEHEAAWSMNAKCMTSHTGIDRNEYPEGKYQKIKVVPLRLGPLRRLGGQCSQC